MVLGFSKCFSFMYVGEEKVLLDPLRVSDWV